MKKFIWITFLIFIFFLVLIYLSNKDQRLFVTLIDGKIGCSSEKHCEDKDKTWYNNSSGISWNKKNNISNIIKKLYELPKENLAAYEIIGDSNFLIRGNPLNPDYWIIRINIDRKILLLL